MLAPTAKRREVLGEAHKKGELHPTKSRLGLLLSAAQNHSAYVGTIEIICSLKNRFYAIHGFTISTVRRRIVLLYAACANKMLSSPIFEWGYRIFRLRVA